MKERDDKLTLKEVEQLCRLYMACDLSILEEAELGYILTQVDYHSSLIDEVRGIMEADALISDRPFVKESIKQSRRLRKWLLPISVAASIALIFSICLYSFQNSSKLQNSGQSYYIAYAGGQRLNDEDAKLQIEAEKQAADDFIKDMAELEAREKETIEKFSTANLIEP